MTTKNALKIGFAASITPVAQAAFAALTKRYGNVALEEADIIVALGGDGFMLQTLHGCQHLGAPVYGMNRGTIGFLMNTYVESDLPARLEGAEEAVIHPLSMTATHADGGESRSLALNEVALLRQGPQAAKLQITVDGRMRMQELVCDGALVATTMRTPGHDYELATGFCFTEGLLAGAPIIGVRYCADGSPVDSEFNIVNVETGGRAPEPTPRLGNVSSSCGWCGSDQLSRYY